MNSCSSCQTKNKISRFPKAPISLSKCMWWHEFFYGLFRSLKCIVNIHVWDSWWLVISDWTPYRRSNVWWKYFMKNLKMWIGHGKKSSWLLVMVWPPHLISWFLRSLLFRHSSSQSMVSHLHVLSGGKKLWRKLVICNFAWTLLANVRVDSLCF